MQDFALVTEGSTDQAILRNILLGYFKEQRVGGCPSLRGELTKKKFRWIRAEEKDVRSYDEASRGYRKRSILLAEGRKNPSLALFLDDLDRRGLVLAPEE